MDVLANGERWQETERERSKKDTEREREREIDRERERETSERHKNKCYLSLTPLSLSHLFLNFSCLQGYPCVHRTRWFTRYAGKR
jgi:hypothetical protein